MVTQRTHSYSEAIPDFVKLAEAYGTTGIRFDKTEQLNTCLMKMIETPGPIAFDCHVASLANCLPVIGWKSVRTILSTSLSWDHCVAAAKFLACPVSTLGDLRRAMQ
ncbi:hypothetical protein LAC81_06765 [Ensifer adhaerens]|uniref:thiamine pyrophosphate-dependent enzyme n=1 Tax=Ensifer adhaerens TaxID=106592 RepID=UPI0022A6E3C0|nr:thiamine pyrophosphate-dependent enzyme [Ensifer adhaerens]UAX93913.1 hypothetical protein LAC78_06760 [Ensifer adhaerens]UAY01548.1 hypothetical protein LAC80_06765 [Ensifer adhaerens]UAY08931.1 hypothetical protein LAC81_06765 [Ensifer adhaerens]